MDANSSPNQLDLIKAGIAWRSFLQNHMHDTPPP